MKRRIEIWLMVVVAMMLNSCYNYDEDTKPDMPVKVDVAFTLSGTSRLTRMADDVVQNGSARDIEILHAIPLIGSTPDALELINGVFVAKTKAKFFRANCDLSVGVNRFRIYAKAIDDAVPSGVTPEAHNGCLAATFPSSISPTTDFSSEIYFSTVPIVTSTDAPEEALTLAGYLSDIANARVTMNEITYEWKTSNNSILKKLFQNFTNKGNVIPGSAANVIEFASQLKSAISSQLFNDDTGEDAIRDRIVELCDNTTNIVGFDYPRGIDLPDGAAVLRWNGIDEFVPQTQTSTVAQITSIDRYAYPPDLYYYVDSPLRTSNESVEYETLYQSTANWADVLANTKFTTTDASVEESTRAVALTDPVQYAVAHLQVNVQAKPTTTGGDTFKDAANKDITIGDNKFPLTGVIVGGQRALDYKFEPKTTSEAGVKFVYDRQVNTYNSENSTYAHYLSTSESEVETTNTLVLQSVDAEDVTFILEFENKSGVLFHGVNNDIIYPNTRFYLVGTIAPTYDSTKGDYTRRVFTKDYTTLVNVTVSSLAGAYNVLPNILSSNLEIGVETTPQWIAATPSTVILE